MSLSALINDNILALHAGVAENLDNLDDIRLIDRVKEIPNKGIFCEIL